jgi:hypothetical protein
MSQARASPPRKAGKESEGAQEGFLDHVLRILLIARQQPREVVGRIQMRQDLVLKIPGAIL